VYIDYDVADRIATITLNRPEAANAQNPELLDELDAAWTRAAEDSEVSVIVLRANGKHFSAGHDLRGGGPVPDKITLDFIIQHEAKRYLEYTLRWRNVPKPSIAAVQGRCISGGLLLCWPCDHCRRRCAVLRSGGADGHRRGRISRPHLGIGPA
jgi:enoyl-CoA hydratase/carnithine racemase